MCSQRQTDTHADTQGPPLRQNKHLDLQLGAYKHTLSHTCAATFRQRDTHHRTVSFLCDRDSCLGCFGASHYSIPSPSWPLRLSAISPRNSGLSGGEGGRRGQKSGLHSVAAGESLCSRVGRWQENAGERGFNGAGGQKLPRPLRKVI